MNASQIPQQPSPPGRGGRDATEREATRTPWTLSSLVLVGVVTASGAAGVIHSAAVGEHWRTYRMAGIFFVLIGAFEVLWAALVAGRPTRALYQVGAAMNAATIALWALSRTIGLPIGPSPGVPQSVGRPDVIATVFEELVVIGLIVLASARWEPGPLARRTYRAGLALMTAVAVPATIWALAAIHEGGGPLDLARRSGLGGDAGPPVATGPAVATGILLLYLAGVARTGRPSFWWSFNVARDSPPRTAWDPPRPGPASPAPGLILPGQPSRECEYPPRRRDALATGPEARRQSVGVRSPPDISAALQLHTNEPPHHRAFTREERLERAHTTRR